MLDTKQLDHFRERQELSLMDVCHRLVYSRTFNDYNEAVETWTEDTTDIPCGLNQDTSSERRRTQDVLLTYDAVLRLAIDVEWDVKDKVRITKRFGETLNTPIDYEITSPIQRGSSGIRLLLKKVSI